MSQETTFSPTTEQELAQILTDAHARRTPLGIVGGGTRVQGRASDWQPLSTAHLSGVVAYEPGEMTLIVRPGTPLAEVQDLLAAENQSLAFEPADMRGVLGGNGTPTIGGMVATNASGPRRLRVGACRDHLLGVRFVDGQGRILKNGGRVMKNVTGLDLGKVLCGAHGTLGVLTEVALKTLPVAHATETLALPGQTIAQAIAVFATALATPYDLAGAAWRDGITYLRIEGLEPQVPYRRERLRTLLRAHEITELDDATSHGLWRELRDLDHFARQTAPLWRLMVQPTDAPAICAALSALGGTVSLDWGGGLIWYCGPGDADTVRATLPRGHATLIRRGDASGPAFTPPPPVTARLSEHLRRAFDPARILNPGLMEA
ncbi:MAG TPA: glycolate oxidase subunit GlcE [Paenirhodobacter sp.]